MSDPRTILSERLRAALVAALGADYTDLDPLIRRSDRADYQADLAMGLAKRVKRPPRDVAAAIVAQLDLAGICERVEIAGAGFINLTLERAFLEREVSALTSDTRFGVPLAERRDKVILDYSAPNCS